MIAFSAAITDVCGCVLYRSIRSSNTFDSFLCPQKSGLLISFMWQKPSP